METERQNKKRVRDESDGLYSPDVKKIRDDLLEFLDGSDPDPVVQDLDSVMRSLQKELSAPCSPVPFLEMTSDSGESRPEFGYLLEASDDELGLPPPSEYVSEQNGKDDQNTDLFRVAFESSGIGEFWEFEDNIHIPSYDSFALGVGDSYGGSGGEYVAFDGLFEHSNVFHDDAADFASNRKPAGTVI